MNQHDPAAVTDTKERLYQEASRLHRLLFDTEVPAELAARYVEAHGCICLSGGREQFTTVQQVIDLNLDAEAVELALRKTCPRHPLRQKMQILTYLAEIDCRYYHLFFNDVGISLPMALLTLVCQFFCTLVKMLKGKLLVWRYALA